MCERAGEGSRRGEHIGVWHPRPAQPLDAARAVEHAAAQLAGGAQADSAEVDLAQVAVPPDDRREARVLEVALSERAVLEPHAFEPRRGEGRQVDAPPAEDDVAQHTVLP